MPYIKNKFGNFENTSHLAWLYNIYLKTGIRVPFPIIADRNGTIARKYGMISNDVSNTQTVRNVYIIDENGRIRAVLVYPMQIGRCIPEILRMIEALQMADITNTSTPANWVPGNPIIQAIPRTYDELEQRMQEIQNSRNGMDWYLSFTNENCLNRSSTEQIEEVQQENRETQE